MNSAPVPADVAAGYMRKLATAAEPAVHAHPDLARRVLRLSARRQRMRRIRRVVASVGGGLAVVGAVAATTLVGTGDYFTVTQPSAAMEPTVRIGDRVVFSRALAPDRGDIVTVHLVRDGARYDAMMRVAALPGDTIGCPPEVDGRCEAVVRNGEPVAERYLGTTGTDPFPTSTVPAGMLFLLGDNRSVAYDSRFIGPVRLADVAGVAVEIKGSGGWTRAVPGAPAHTGPGVRDNVDPAAAVPEAPDAPAGGSAPR